MDKYAVDLDQVLNDFEYSELTDQYNISRNASGTVPPLNQNNITKHSINNVFHSLNEYLNTSINVNDVNQIENNLSENKENFLSDRNVNVSLSKLKEEEPSIKDANFKTDALLLDFSGETNEGGGDTCSAVETNEGDGDKRSMIEINEGGGDECSVRETSESVAKQCSSVDSVDGDGVKSEVKEEGGLVEIAQDERYTEDRFEEKTDLYINEDGNNTFVYSETVSDGDTVDDAAETVGTVTVDVQNMQNIVDVAEKIESKSFETLDMQSESEVEEKVLPEEISEKVGFDDNLELDESEVMRMLEELEDEELETIEDHEHHSASNLLEDVGCGSEKEATDCLSLDRNREEITSVLKEKTEEIEPRVDDNAITELNITEIEETIVKPTAEEGNSETFTENPISEQITSNVTSEDKSPEVKMPDDQKKEEAVKKNEEHEVEEESSVDSLTRPRDLPLSGEGDQPKRKIDLIGEPGSTPYNNVYISKEIPKNKDKPYESDTDYSVSSSPTFSDESSTTSTVSADELHAESKCVGTTERTGQTLENTAAENDNPIPASADPAPDVINPTSDETVVAAAPPEVSDASVCEAVTNSGKNPNAEPGAANPQVENIGEVNVSAINMEKQWLGKEAPLWVPDSDATSCLHCDMKFTVLKRRHHCRACGLVLCSKCCHLRFRLEYLDAEARVCNKCHDILNKDSNSTSSSDMSPDVGNSPAYRPNPNNPLEYCSTVSPLEQVAGSNLNPPAIMVPVGVLKRKGSNKSKSNKSVMFCDGIRPGSDLTNLDNDFNYNNSKSRKSEKSSTAPAKPNRNLPAIDPETNTFIPKGENFLPPTATVSKTEISYSDCQNGPPTVEILKKEQLTFALHVNLYVHVKIVDMSCCVNKTAWCFSTEGLINVGQDEIVILLEVIEEEAFVPKDVFYHINTVYNDAVKGTTVKELGLSLHNESNFLDSKNHAGFVYIRPSFQCLENIIKPKETYLIGILIHRWETPWAKLFPLRLILRLGAEYRYYPSPIISTRHRESVFVEIGHTIINLLADFRNFSYTLPQIRGLTIYMEDKNTTITIPANRYDQVMKSMSNSSDHILAFAGNFSQLADSHLVCIQDTQGNENCYSTHAINIHNKPRKITGASFIVFNGALKSSSGLTAKSNIVEDGLMIQVLPEHMQLIRDNLRAMKNHTIPCGCVNAVSDETVNIVWGENDVNFNIGVVSAIDNTPLSGVPSIRVHNAKNHICSAGSRFIRWTEVFIIQNGDDNPKNQDAVDISRVSESIAKATCDALVKYLDLLVANGCQKIGIRTTLHVDNVSYLAGSNGGKLAPIYMKSLDDELIPVLHRITTNNLGEHSIVLELIFRILNL